MVLSDQQLRQELISYGEVVPLISQRNREQLRARLELLRSQKSKQGASSPSRTRTTASPTRRSTASPSRAAATASPSRAAATASPTRRNTASPSRTATASPSRRTTTSPTRTRSSTTTTTSASGSGRGTRSKQTPNLIELSDSDVESSGRVGPTSRSTRTGQTTPQKQTRSTSSSATKSPGKVTDDVEESIARHRREIKQLLDSARNRDRVIDTRTSSSSSQQRNKSSDRTGSPTRTRRESSKSDDEDDRRSSSSKSSPKRGKKSSDSFWSKFGSCIKNLLKFLLVSSLLLGGLYYIYQNYASLFPRREAIRCSYENATHCEDMKPVLDAVRKQLQVRAGEVECRFRPKFDALVPRPDIERYLNERGLKFDLGDEERWRALLRYIVEKPVSNIILWTAQNEQTNDTRITAKLSTKDAIRSLTCRARQDVNKTLRNVFLVVLGSTGLLTLAWFLQRQSKNHAENERTFKTYLDKALKLLEDQYEKHVHDPRAQPWLAISHIRDKLIPEADQERLQHIWERVKAEINEQTSRIRAELQDIDGKKSDVWRWIKSVSASSSPKKGRSINNEDTDEHSSTDVGLTECLKLRNCFRSEDRAHDDEIDDAIDRIQKRCASIQRIEHIGIHAAFIYLKFSSKEAAAQGYHLLNNWKYQNRHINVKYVRLNRYLEHFPEAENINNEN